MGVGFVDPASAEARWTAWSLYNSATEVMKKQSPARQVEGFKALGSVLVDSPN